MEIRKIVGVTWVVGALTGCPNAAEQRALEGAEALDACDLRAAAEDFNAARSMGLGRADVALAAALTSLATLPEDPALQALAPRLGFDRALDASIFWGEGGVLEQLSNRETCEAIGESLQPRWPHPSLRGGTGAPDFVDTIDATLTLGDLVATLRALRPRLERDIESLQVAADGLEGSATSVEFQGGGCGLGARAIRIQAPELLVAATVLRTITAATEALAAYDGALSVRTFLRGSGETAASRAAYARMLNEHFLHLTNEGQLATARLELLTLTLTALEALDAAGRAPREANTLFDWRAMPTSVASDSRAWVTAARDALDPSGTGTMRIHGLSPALSLDVGSFFSRPFDMGRATVPQWTIEETWVSFDGRFVEADLGPRFTPNPFAAPRPSFNSTIAWDRIASSEVEAWLDPGDRWEAAYGCTSSR